MSLPQAYQEMHAVKNKLVVVVMMCIIGVVGGGESDDEKDDEGEADDDDSFNAHIQYRIPHATAYKC